MAFATEALTYIFSGMAIANEVYPSKCISSFSKGHFARRLLTFNFFYL